ncbi:MAG: THUMP domain-containing protein [Bacteroidales bacterium]|nr:THUMP domain-containing protein [Bacteroidales bacterium]
MKQYQFIAKTLAGMEEALAEELISLGAQEVKPVIRGVSFSGDKALMYKVNYQSRLAIRFLVSIQSFPAINEKELYKSIYSVAWENYMDSAATLAVDAVTQHPKMTHSLFIAQLAKDAVVDRFRNQEGVRPSVDLDTPDLRIHVHLDHKEATILLDSSNVPLFKRGYRIGALVAPINEVLAAGLLELSQWDEKTPLYDPMCGSGTFLIEAAMKATKTPAGKYRSEFGFMKWKDFDEKLWHQVKEEAEALIVPLEVEIKGSDLSRRAITMARRNIEAAGFSDVIHTEWQDFFQQTKNFSGFIITNPPYDERLSLTDFEAFYKNIGTTLKHLCTNSQAWLIVSSPDATDAIGLHSSRKIKVFNGSIECRFLKYDIYQGSKKDFQQELTT